MFNSLFSAETKLEHLPKRVGSFRYLAKVGRDVFEESSSEQWPILRARIHWLATAGNRRQASVLSSITQRLCIRLTPRNADPHAGEKTAHQFAATCTFGEETAEGQMVELSLWVTVDLAALGLPGTDLVLVEGDVVVATGKVI